METCRGFGSRGRIRGGSVVSLSALCRKGGWGYGSEVSWGGSEFGPSGCSIGTTNEWGMGEMTKWLFDIISKVAMILILMASRIRISDGFRMQEIQSNVDVQFYMFL
mmetsp:Transcript_28610/g.60385  ORF Transcript_28610/g.60385 Transcript_28610/m.60385 type:complete len:107 (+) Transcript_28610:531-851(+)